MNKLEDLIAYTKRPKVVKALEGTKNKHYHKDDDLAFNDFIETLPENQATETDFFDMYRYWELNEKPKDFQEAIKKHMFAELPDGWHANSIAYNPETDEYEWMKRADHKTSTMEFMAYNGNMFPQFLKEFEMQDDPQFRENWNIISDSNRPGFLKYVRKNKVKAHSNGGVLKALNGAQLQLIELTDTPNVLPTGDLHKNKHEDFGIDVTKKGIPVITVEDDSAETLPEIQEQADSVVQHAEVEKEEIIFNKDLTDKIEDLRKQWNESHDDDLAYLAGLILTKEILFNTNDNEGLIEQVSLKV